jgi:hypothetical protein
MSNYDAPLAMMVLIGTIYGKITRIICDNESTDSEKLMILIDLQQEIRKEVMNIHKSTYLCEDS